MKSRRRVYTRFAWSLALGVAFFAIYLQTGLLPGNLRDKAQTRIFETTGRRVTFTRVIFMPGMGLSFDDFRIAGAEGPSLFSAKRLRIDAKLLPFLFEKKIIIRNLMLESPLFEWSNAPTPVAPTPIKTEISGQLDVPVAPAGHTVTFQSLKAEGTDALLPENVYLEQIEIRKGLARFYAAAGTLNETVEIADLKMAYRKPPVVDFTGNIRVGSPAYASLRVEGGWDLDKAGYEFFIQFKSDRVPTWLDHYQKKHILILQEGRIDLTAKLESIAETRAAFHAKSRLSNARIQAAHASIRGQSAFDAKGVFDFNRQTFERYKGTLYLEAVDLENLSAQFPKIERVRGRIGFEPDLVTIESIQGAWKKLAFEAKGTIKSFKDLILAGEIRSRLDIQDALALIPAEQKKLLKGFRLGGTCDALTTLKGSLKKGGVIGHEHRLVIERGFLENTERKLKLEDLSSELFMDDKGLQIRRTRFRSGQTAYRLDASIPKKPASRGSLELATALWKLKGDYDVEGNDLRVRSGRADGYGTALSFNGFVRNLHDPQLELSGEARLDLPKVRASLPVSHPLKTLGLDGLITGPFSIDGPWNKPMFWNLNLKAKAERLTIQNQYKLDDFSANIRSERGILKLEQARATTYGGSLTANGAIDGNRPAFPATWNLSVTDIELARIAAEMKPPKKDLTGKLVLQAEWTGPLQDQNAWTGKGSLGIRDGNFGRTDRFKAMGKLPFVHVEGMDDVTFHQMRGTFDIGQKKVWTDDLSIYGDNVNLFLSGTMGFDAMLDMSMTIRYSKGILDGALDTGGIVPLVVSEANNMISDYHVRGTLGSPVFEKSFLPVNPVGSVTKKVNTLAKAVAG